MNWNEQQQQALAKLHAYVNKRDGDGEPFVLAGLAGTGKTTVISACLSEFKEMGLRIALVAPTGKAAAVLNSKQNSVVAQTIHSLLYGAPLDPDAEIIQHIERLEAALDAHNNGSETLSDPEMVKEELQDTSNRAARHLVGRQELQFLPKDPDEIREFIDLVICDEASMVAPTEVKTIAALRRPTIYLGDPNQLFPVGYDRFSVKLDQPTALLTEIMRQADGSPILDLSRRILDSGGLPRGVKNIEGIRTAMGTNPLPLMRDVNTKCIVYMNRTRRTVSATVRNSFFADKIDASFPYLPFVGEKLMVNANRRELGVMKGDEVEITEILRYSGNGPIDKFTADVAFRDHRGTIKQMRIWLNDLMLTVGHPLGMEKPAYGDKEGFQAFKYNFIASKQGVDVAFPYAITCHKSQGSEWDSVLVFNEGHKSSRQQYLYTAVTRARSDLALAGVY